MKDILTKILLIVVLLAAVEAGSVFYILKIKTNTNTTKATNQFQSKNPKSQVSSENNIYSGDKPLRMMNYNKVGFMGEVVKNENSYLTLRSEDEMMLVNISNDKIPVGTRSFVANNINEMPETVKKGLFHLDMINLGNTLDVVGIYNNTYLNPELIVLIDN